MAVDRRTFIKTSGVMALAPSWGAQSSITGIGVFVNDVHSQLNPTRVLEMVPVDSTGALQRAIKGAADAGHAVCIAGGRHAMGAQQFASDAVMLDTTKLNRVHSFDRARGIVEVDAGIMWPALIDYLLKAQDGLARQWGIAQKQTGADRLTMGGALAANVHGRGLKMKPFIADVESFVLIDARGEARTCSRTENAELFRLAIGGYGLFGPIATVRLRLAPRQKIQCVVEVRTIDDLPKAFEQYSKYYLSTSGQIYWSDTHQLSTYLDDYHVRLDKHLGVKDRATEMITEIYVPRAELPSFMAEVGTVFRSNGVPIVYGTVRLIERDEESFLAWATQPYACIIFNLHTVHTRDGIDRAAQAFRHLIDMGVKRGGRYYLTYHRHARRDQVEASYPQLPEFLRTKRKYDPQERFQSEWYRHYKSMFADRI